LLSPVPPDNIPAPSPDTQQWLSFVLDPALDKPEEGEPPVGDYNDNGIVDAADFVVWRNAGPTDTLPNDSTPGTVDQSDYDAWRTGFGSGAVGDGVVDLNDIGEGWHRFSALIKPESVTVELDLYRDGMNNATGQVGVDASETWPLQMNTAAAAAGAFNSLRIGPPSGVSGNEEAVFDNLFLTLVDAPMAAGLSAGAVPEPATWALFALGMVATFASTRHSR
jgi:hypothetical protein